MFAGIASAENAPPAARVQAIGMLLDRGWGKAPTTISGADGGASAVDIAEEDDTKPIEHQTLSRGIGSGNVVSSVASRRPFAVTPWTPTCDISADR